VDYDSKVRVLGNDAVSGKLVATILRIAVNPRKRKRAGSSTFQWSLHLKGRGVSQKKNPAKRQAARLIGLLLDGEDGCSTLLRNVGEILSDYMMSVPKKYITLIRSSLN
jgi:hypothetical protein